MPYADPERNRQYQREWRAKRRREWFADKSCVQCGSTEELQIDHVDPRSKSALLKGKNGTATIWSWSPERRAVELAKCQVLCRPCHERKTFMNWDGALLGEQHPRSRLSAEQLIDIRDRLTRNESASSIAADYPVSKWAIDKIRQREAWRES